MTELQRAEHVARDNILKLFSDDEIAKVSSAETRAVLAEGGEYIDLEHLDQGVQRATAATKITMEHVVPRSAVGGETWNNILAQLDRDTGRR
jgi:hypothetical protein